MKLVVDGLIFQKDPHGGIARVFREILPRMCDLAPDLQVQLFLDGPARSGLPAHPQIELLRAPAVKPTLRVRGVWRRLLYPFRRAASRAWNASRGRWLAGSRQAIWHSTYYTLPPASWQGPQVVTVHDLIQEKFLEDYNDPLDEVGRQQKRRCIAQAAALICYLQAVRQQVEQMYPQRPAQVFTIPNACSPVFRRLELPPTPASPPLEEPFLLYVGGRAPYKNFSGLLEAYAGWSGREGVLLAAAGPPWTKAELQQLEQRGLAGRVRLLPGASDETLCALYNRALAFVHPSLDEGFGIPLLEAMACGCPLVASDIPTTREVAGDCPVYFEPRRPESLRSALDQALREGRESGRVLGGLERVRSFAWERTARETLAVYRRLQEPGSDG